MSDPLDAAEPVTDDQGMQVEPATESAQAPAQATDEAPAAEVAVDHRLDLDGIERDLADVELALARLDSGEYWTDEVTGAPIPDEHLAEHPTARRLADR